MVHNRTGAWNAMAIRNLYNFSSSPSLYGCWKYQGGERFLATTNMANSQAAGNQDSVTYSSVTVNSASTTPTPSIQQTLPGLRQ